MRRYSRRTKTCCCCWCLYCFGCFSECICSHQVWSFTQSIWKLRISCAMIPARSNPYDGIIASPHASTRADSAAGFSTPTSTWIAAGAAAMTAAATIIFFAIPIIVNFVWSVLGLSGSKTKLQTLLYFSKTYGMSKKL